MPNGRDREKKGKTGEKGRGALLLLRAGVLGGAASILVLLLAALLIWKSVVPENAAGTAVILAGLIGGFSAGLSAAGEEGGTLLRAILSGAVTFLLFAAVGSVIAGRLPNAAGAGAPLGACLCGGAVAGLFSARLRGGQKKRRRRPGKE